jgi:hypothetical protein
MLGVVDNCISSLVCNGALDKLDQGLLIYQQGTEISYDDILIDLVA